VKRHGQLQYETPGKLKPGGKQVKKDEKSERS
jgi:hypothetical protein